MNNKQQLLAYPYIDEIEYREKIDPDKLNLILRSLEESVLRAILRSSEITDLQSRLNLGVVSSYEALSKHVGTLFSYENLDSGVAFATAYDQVITTSGGFQDRVAGIATLAWDEDRKYSKVPRYDTDNDSIPDYVSPAVSIYVDGTLRSADNSAYFMLSRRNDAFWIEQTASGIHTIQVNLPPSLNKSFNYIELAPFPVFGVEIRKVKYQDPSNLWKTIYDVTDKDYKFYNNSGPLVMHLSPKETNGTFEVTCNVDDTGGGTGPIGFSSMDFGLIDYEDKTQTIYIKFENAPASNITLLSGEFDFYINDNIKYDKFISKLAIANSFDGTGDISINTVSTDRYNFGKQSIDASNGLYLKVVMNEINRTTPVIRGYKLTYEV